MTCTICRHTDRKRIERALIQGDRLRDIARRHNTSKDAVQRPRGCFAEMYDRGVLPANTVRVLNLRSKLERAIAEKIDPDIDRRTIIECLADIPETTGEFMPFVLAELAGDPCMN